MYDKTVYQIRQIPRNNCLLGLDVLQVLPHTLLEARPTILAEPFLQQLCTNPIWNSGKIMSFIGILIKLRFHIRPHFLHSVDQLAHIEGSSESKNALILQRVVQYSRNQMKTCIIDNINVVFCIKDYQYYTKNRYEMMKTYWEVVGPHFHPGTYSKSCLHLCAHSVLPDTCPCSDQVR